MRSLVLMPAGSKARRSAAGFTLVENLVAAAVMGVILSAMAELLIAFSNTGGKTMERPFAQSLSDRALDRILSDLATENSLAAMVDGQRYDRAYRLAQRKAQVTQFFLDLFPENGRPIEAPSGRTLAAIPTKVLADQGTVYDLDALYGPWFLETPFSSVRLYSASGEDLSAFYTTQAEFLNSLAEPQGIRYVVRLQCFGLSDAAMRLIEVGTIDPTGIPESANLVHVGGSVSGELPGSGLDTKAYALLADSAIGDPRTPGGLDTGRLFVYDKRAGRPATAGGFRSEYVECLTRIVVARTYDAKKFADDWKFVSGGKPDIPLASSSLIVSGRVMGQ
ncbi:MAG: prepilin-type N-terminal cleavage/methylation domain-containing protein [Candidatus Sericytochromatia bacterium]|nr:prepilin-type N-terminal cleavage/methylation domain-containing protein [Candidatus Sericytochromatia bacterium]